MVDQRLNKVAALYVVYNPQFFQKSGAHVRLSCGSAESSNIFTGKPPW